jgi:DNA-binding NarL/FixJ family response regulator
MRLDFTVLWIDDQPKHVKSFSEGMRFRLKDLGFDLQVIPAETLKFVDEYVKQHVHDDAIDLVMVDYDLGVGTGAGGEEALQKIRDKFPFKEVLFYSATDREILRKIAFEAKVDGAHFSTRLSLVEDAMHVVNKLIGKVLDIDHMRGVVMSASSDIDYMVEASLLAVYGRLEKAEQDAFRESIVLQVNKKLTDWKDDLDKAEKKNNLNKLISLRHLFSSNDRLTNLLGQLSNGWANEQQNEHLQKLKIYQDEIVPRRNKLAHVVLKRQNGKQPELVGANGSWAVEDMTQLRRDFIEHRENFQTIAVLVDAPLI